MGELRGVDSRDVRVRFIWIPVPARFMHEGHPGQRVLVEGKLPQLNRRSPHLNSSRLVLAFFSAADIDAVRRAQRRITKSGSRATLAEEGGKRNSFARPYFGLRLQDEQLLIAEAPVATVQSMVDDVRREHPA